MKVHEQYVEGPPTAQNVIDLVGGWSSKLPDFLATQAGPLELFADLRVSWAVRALGGVYGKTIIELGPLEGGHTYQLLNAGAAHVTAIEANTYSYMKCLITKELLRLNNVSFLLGNFVPWLAEGRKYAEVIWASGVLYHMQDPIGLLKLISGATDTLFLWTHYVSDEEMPEGDPRRALIADSRTVDWRGHSIKLYRRPYDHAAENVGFMGGVHADPVWMERADILLVLKELGFSHIDILPGDSNHPQGPNFSLVARRHV